VLVLILVLMLMLMLMGLRCFQAMWDRCERYDAGFKAMQRLDGTISIRLRSVRIRSLETSGPVTVTLHVGLNVSACWQVADWQVEQGCAVTVSNDGFGEFTRYDSRGGATVKADEWLTLVIKDGGIRGVRGMLSDTDRDIACHTSLSDGVTLHVTQGEGKAAKQLLICRLNLDPLADKLRSGAGGQCASWVHDGVTAESLMQPRVNKPRRPPTLFPQHKMAAKQVDSLLPFWRIQL
jgi:hypothetical protein